MDARITNLIKEVSKLRELQFSKENITSISSILNELFEKHGKCLNVIYTYNTGKLPFGCIVFPKFESQELNNFLVNAADLQFHNYYLEIDSKMFDYGLSDSQVVQIVLFNIYHLISDKSPGERLREAIDLFFLKEDNFLKLRDAIKYQNILILGLSDALHQITSCFHLPDDVEADAYLDSFGFEDKFKDALHKLYLEIPGCDNETLRCPNLSMLQWSLRLYKNVEDETIPAMNLLEKLKSISGSRLYIDLCNATIKSITTIYRNSWTDSMIQEAATVVLNEGIRSKGLIGKIRYNGLRDIENDLYEFSVRLKSADAEYDSIYILKQINSRLTILDDYIMTHPDDPDLQRWDTLRNNYMQVRDELARKKLVNRNYNVFVDYDRLYARPSQTQVMG